MSITHSFVSEILDSEDTTLVRPSNWNADHIGINEHTHSGSSSGSIISHLVLSGSGVNTHDQIDIDLIRLADTSGSNTGDQNLTGYIKSFGDVVDGHMAVFDGSSGSSIKDGGTPSSGGGTDLSTIYAMIG